MIGLDTNLLIRYLTEDNAEESARAAAFIERRLSAANPGFLSVVVMAETAWVLERAYGLRRRELAATIERLLQVAVFTVQHEQAVFAALTALRQGQGGFADALIGALGAGAGCSHTATLDRRALRLPWFQPL